MLLRIVKRWSAVWIACLGMFFSSLPALSMTYRVTNDLDAGAGSFRQAISDINASTMSEIDLDPVINFAGNYTIKPYPPIQIIVLPHLVDVVKIIINGNGSTIDGGNLYPLQSNTENLEINNLIILPDPQSLAP